jgi:hypothetical protein
MNYQSFILKEEDYSMEKRGNSSRFSARPDEDRGSRFSARPDEDRGSQFIKAEAEAKGDMVPESVLISSLDFRV